MNPIKLRAKATNDGTPNTPSEANCRAWRWAALALALTLTACATTPRRHATTPTQSANGEPLKEADEHERAQPEKAPQPEPVNGPPTPAR